jgi:DNA repair protein RadD
MALDTTPTGLRPLRPHQVTALDQLRATIAAGSRRPMVQAPTGAGKTVIAAHIVAGAHAKGNRVTFVVPALGLVDQTFERFAENGIHPADMGVIQADHPWRRPHAPIQIATAQTLARRDLPECEFVVVDEAHKRQGAVDKWMLESPGKIFVGLSATPWSVGLGKRYDALIKTASISDLIAGGYLSQFRVFAPSHPDLTGVSTVLGDFHEGELADVMSSKELVGDVVTTWLARAQDRPTLCFAVNRAHARLLAEQFSAAGVACAYVDANTPREEREAIGKRLASGQIKIVVNIGTLTTGIDWDVRCIVLARPTKSDMLFVQIIGRGLRTADGKDHCLILDHSDTHLRLGMVTDIDFDQMDDGTPKAKAAAKKRLMSLPVPTECISCQGLIPALMRECPCCGAVRRKPSGVEYREGELQELSAAGQRSKDANSIGDMIRAKGKQAVYSELLGYADERSRSKGWAAHKYRELFGVWPNRLSDEWGAEPSALIRSWIRSRDIAWAKSQQKLGGHHVH